MSSARWRPFCLGLNVLNCVATISSAVMNKFICFVSSIWHPTFYSSWESDQPINHDILVMHECTHRKWGHDRPTNHLLVWLIPWWPGFKQNIKQNELKKNNFVCGRCNFIQNAHNMDCSMYHLSLSLICYMQYCLVLDQVITRLIYINSSSPNQNGSHFADDIFKCIFMNENVRILNKIWLKFVLKGWINNNRALVQIMAWRGSDDKPLSETILSLFTDAYMRLSEEMS